MPRLELDDLDRIVIEMRDTLGNSGAIQEALDVWGIDLQALVTVLLRSWKWRSGTGNPMFTNLTLMTAGVLLGVKIAQELEMRRLTEVSDEAG